MKKFYNAPEFDVIQLEVEDLILASGAYPEEGEEDDEFTPPVTGGGAHENEGEEDW